MVFTELQNCLSLSTIKEEAYRHLEDVSLG